MSDRPVGLVGAMLSKYSYEIFLFHFFAIAVAKLWGYGGQGILSVTVVWLSALVTGLALGAPLSRALDLRRSGRDNAA